MLDRHHIVAPIGGAFVRASRLQLGIMLKWLEFVRKSVELTL